METNTKDEVKVTFDLKKSRRFEKFIQTNVKECIRNTIYNDSYYNEKSWNKYRQYVLENFQKLQFKQVMDDYFCCGTKKLHVSRSELCMILRYSILSLDQFFRQVSYERWEEVDKNNCSFQDVENLIKECIPILVRKQQGK